jgi:secondary thiamine-phosphate synthase enzyme
METFEVQTEREGFIDITARVQEVVTASGVKDGMCLVFCPHTTAAITINENADPDVQRDIKYALHEAFPNRAEFQHAEGNSAAHAKSSVVGCSETIPIQRGRLVLGVWQGVYFCEFDGPRTRRCCVQVLGD